MQKSLPFIVIGWVPWIKKKNIFWLQRKEGGFKFYAFKVKCSFNTQHEFLTLIRLIAFAKPNLSQKYTILCMDRFIKKLNYHQNRFLNECARKKNLKSLRHGFFVEYRRTYVLNKIGRYHLGNWLQVNNPIIDIL